MAHDATLTPGFKELAGNIAGNMNLNGNFHMPDAGKPNNLQTTFNAAKPSSPQTKSSHL
jgi:hypothetical protein